MRRHVAISVVAVLGFILLGAPSPAASEAPCPGSCTAAPLPSFELAVSTQGAQDGSDSNTAGVVVGAVLVVGWAIAGGVMIARARRSREVARPTEVTEPEA